MIIRYPDKWRAGELDDQLISFVDFKSTTLSAGIEPPEYVDGRAFVGKFQSSESRQYIHAAADRLTGSTTRSVQCAMYASNTCAIIQSEALLTADLSRANANHAGAAAS